MKAGYYEYMASDAWRVKRVQRLEIDGYRCRTCGATADEYPLQVHHVTYERLGHEDAERDLITLCSLCHQAITDTIRRRRYASRFVNTEFEPIATKVTARIEVNTYGMANSDIQPDIIVRDARPQRQGSEPARQVRQDDERDFFQAEQDRRRSRANGAH